MKDLEEFEKMESEEFILKMVFMEPLHLLQPMFNVSRTPRATQILNSTRSDLFDL